MQVHREDTTDSYRSDGQTGQTSVHRTAGLWRIKVHGNYDALSEHVQNTRAKVCFDFWIFLPLSLKET